MLKLAKISVSAWKKIFKDKRIDTFIRDSRVILVKPNTCCDRSDSDGFGIPAGKLERKQIHGDVDHVAHGDSHDDDEAPQQQVKVQCPKNEY